jgi:hypothetical protein
MVTDIIHMVAQPVVINIAPLIVIMVVATAITEPAVTPATHVIAVVIIITTILATLAVIPAVVVVMATIMVVTTTNQKFSS